MLTAHNVHGTVQTILVLILHAVESLKPTVSALEIAFGMVLPAQLSPHAGLLLEPLRQLASLKRTIALILMALTALISPLLPVQPSQLKPTALLEVMDFVFGPHHAFYSIIAINSPPLKHAVFIQIFALGMLLVTLADLKPVQD